MTPMRELKSRIDNFNASLLAIFDGGATQTCKVCGFTFESTVEECAYYLTHGWPKHCGQTMRQKFHMREDEQR